MKVVHVTLRFDAPGGVETNVLEVTRRLRALGEEAEVFASDLYDEGRWERRSNYAPEVQGVPVRRFPVVKRLIPGLTMPLWPGLLPALADSGADVIHAHSHRYGHVLQAAAVARRTGIPLVVSTHYHPAQASEPPLKRALLRGQDVWFGGTAYRTARALVVESQLEAAMVGEFAPRQRVRIIPPGIDLAEWATPDRDRPPPGLPERHLVYAGRIAENKGLTTLLYALARIDPRARPHLVLVGRDWGERPKLESLAKALGLTDRLVWLGHVADRSAYRAILRGAQAFVLPSEWEAFGLVLLEAMAAGTPIIATEAGAVPEVLAQGRAGRLVGVRDSEALAEAVAEVLRDDALARSLVAGGRARVADLDWNVCAERHRALYRELAG